MKKLYLTCIISITGNILCITLLFWQREHTIPQNSQAQTFTRSFPDNIETYPTLTSHPFNTRHITKLKTLIDNGAVLLVNHKDEVLLNYHGAERFIPASTLKILTSLAALHYLGSEHRFKTEFLYDTVHNLYIKGYGDPLLTSSELQNAIKELFHKGLRKIHKIYLDNSLFAEYTSVPGNENTHKSYDAKNSSLAVNFNTISYKRKRRNISSANAETPFIPYALTILKKAQKDNRKYKHFRTLQIAIKDEEDSLRYFGELFKHFCVKQKIRVNAGISIKRAPKQLKTYYTHYNSKNLQMIIKELLHFSNNFIANQLTLSLALLRGEPATLHNGVEMIGHFAQKVLKLSITLREGAGLSYANRVRPLDLIHILTEFRPYKHLLKIIEHDNTNITVRAKTGSLKTVDAYTGFIDTQKHGEVRFTIILNQSTNNKSQILKFLLKVLS